jgi:hypothetical protein
MSSIVLEPTSPVNWVHFREHRLRWVIFLEQNRSLPVSVKAVGDGREQKAETAPMAAPRAPLPGVVLPPVAGLSRDTRRLQSGHLSALAPQGFY